MSISNYSELQTAVTNWMKRSNLSGQAQDFITLAEADIRTKFRGRTFEADASLTGVVDSRELGTSQGFPTDFVEPIALYLTTWGDHERITQMASGLFPYDVYGGPPDAWAIDGEKIVLDKPCDQAHTFRFRYRQSIQLSDASPTNFLLTNYPNVYLCGALHWASMYTFRGDAVKAVVWKPAFEEAIDEVDFTESRPDATSVAVVDPAIVRRPRWNINRGD